MNNWVILTILYAIFLAFINTSKKKAVEKNSVYEVLAKMTLIAFMLSFIITKDAFKIDYNFIPILFLKASIIVVSWILAAKAMQKMSISLFSMIKISRIIFSVLLSSIFLGEKITYITLIGMTIIICGLMLVNKEANREANRENNKKTNNVKQFRIILMILMACLLSSISAIIDKKILVHINSGQLQFWFLMFLTIIYWTIIKIKKEKVSIIGINKNYWILIAAICLVVGDRLLFKANEITDSNVIITILLGKLLFKEKKIIKKLLYSLFIILGILIMLMS